MATLMARICHRSTPKAMPKKLALGKHIGQTPGQPSNFGTPNSSGKQILVGIRKRSKFHSLSSNRKEHIRSKLPYMSGIIPEKMLHVDPSPSSTHSMLRYLGILLLLLLDRVQESWQ